METHCNETSIKDPNYEELLTESEHYVQNELGLSG
jgi:hypothetical protein